MRKYSAALWVGIKPEAYGEVTVTAETDKKDGLNEKIVASEQTSFAKISFAHWHFDMTSKSTMKRLKIKAKKFVFYKLIFRCEANFARATIVAADIKVRFTGLAK
jgi:hypothetical protein